jgi:hypothetical protein
MISPDDVDMFTVTDDPVEAAAIIENFYTRHIMVTNF